MFAIVKKVRTVANGSNGQIPPSKVEANTHDWRTRVRTELDKRPRGEHAKIVEFVQRWYPRFSAGTLTGLLADDEKPGQQRYSRYVGLINRYLWPEEFGEVDEQLARVLRTMTIDEQRALADFLATRRKTK